MTYRELIKRASRQSRESYGDDHWLLWIQDWLMEMSKVSKLRTTHFESLVPGTSAYDLPSDCQRLVLLFHETAGGERYQLDELRDSDTESEGYHFWDGEIVLQEVDFTSSDKLFLVYFRRITTPSDVSDLDDEIADIPEEHQGCGIYYLWARAIGRERWQDTGQYALFMAGKQEYADTQGTRMRNIRKRPWI